MSIQPPFTWEAIMEPGKVDELIHTLVLAREGAKRMVSGKSVSRRGKQQPVGTDTVTPENGVLHTNHATDDPQRS
ncbi:MAG: hypothetical protein ACRDTD_07320 [Pseudonocardiaceae bacterium]